MSSAKKNPVKETRKEYELAKPIVQKGKELLPPATTKLTDSQAEKFKESGHIK